jgi:hypothetical protein
LSFLEEIFMEEEFPTEETALEQSAESVPTENEGQDSGAPQNGAIPGQMDNAQPAESSFLQGSPLDPTKLPPELQPIFKKMQGAYTKRMQEAAAWRRDAELVQRFNQDRDFAFQTTAQWAAQNGYSLAPLGAQGAQGQPQTQQVSPQSVKVPPELVDVIRSNLPQEMQWLAESQAPALWQAAQMMLRPLVEQQQLSQRQSVEQQQRAAEQEWDKLADELGQTAPGWEEHEPEMAELLRFLQGRDMKHPKYGSKHQLLYNLITGNAAATAQVTKRMNAAAKNRPSSGMTTGRTAGNLEDRIRTAKSSQDAFKLAALAADQQGRG